MKEKNNTLVFWGNKDILSNFYVSDFKYMGLTFASIEQCLSWKLSKLQNNKSLTSNILKERNPMEVRKLMRNFKIKSSVVNEHKMKYLKDIILSKVESNFEFKELLISTQDKQLVFASDKDFILGSGLHYSLPSNYYKDELRGNNLFGVALMELRNSLIIK